MKSYLKALVATSLFAVGGQQLCMAQDNEKKPSYTDSLKTAIAADYDKISAAASYSKYDVLLGKNINKQQLDQAYQNALEDRSARMEEVIQVIAENHPETTFIIAKCLEEETIGSKTTKRRWLELSAEATIDNRPVVLLNTTFPKFKY